MRAHKRTIFFCIVLAIFAFGFTIFFNILDQKTNSIFYDTFLAIFTGLIISIVTSYTFYQMKKTSLLKIYNYNTLYPLNIENCENIVLSCISRIEELSSQLCNSIEDKIFILEKLLKFESKWEDDKKNIMNQVSLINEHLK